MDARSLIEIIEKDQDYYHQDVHFIKQKLKELLEREEYESIPTIHRWLEELIEKHHGIKIN